MEAKLQKVFLAGFESYRQGHGLSVDQHRAAQAIMACQSEELGHEEWACLEDGYTERKYHSCRHRSCPRCHGAKTAEWLTQTQARLLPCDHYHVVFTLPHELNALWHYNRAWCRDHLFKASAETLRQLLVDETYLGGEAGMLSSLHTWGRTLNFHPHVHVLVSGGGLNGRTWRSLKKAFLLPVGVIKAKFRGKWLSWLNEAYATGALTRPAEWTERDWRTVLRQVSRKNWNVRIQGGYRQGKAVASYLSRYLRGGPIKDHRIVSLSDTSVTFRYRDSCDGIDKDMALSREQFLSRVLWHVPVKGQHNVRYYGLYRPPAHAKRQLARESLGADAESKPVKPDPAVPQCPRCGSPLFHRASTRRKFSSIGSHSRLEGRNFVQQDVQADRVRASPHRPWHADETPPLFFGPCGGSLT